MDDPRLTVETIADSYFASLNEANTKLHTLKENSRLTTADIKQDVCLWYAGYKSRVRGEPQGNLITLPTVEEIVTFVNQNFDVKAGRQENARWVYRSLSVFANAISSEMKGQSFASTTYVENRFRGKASATLLR